MKCWKCGKEMDNPKGQYTIQGIKVEVGQDVLTPEDIKYANCQLGKYSDGKGKCHVAICYECYIDGLFHVNDRLGVATAR